ncbi:MAG: PQQ-binding-like beta-propeller repeat protein [Verrucomicrobia bacterium]|nr:PQQ-binding-like beta-propeller repeat protein [Verrucomicrobiota bacterium]
MKVIRLLASLAFAATALHAADWPQWRGPNFNGSSPETGLPAKFGKTEGVAWAVPMPGPSASATIIFGNAVFISSGDKNSQSLVAMCLDRKTGKIVWQNKIADGYSRDNKSNYSSPSPVTDGKLVFFYYGNGDLVAFDVTGKKIWQRNIQKDYGEFAYQWTYSASPLLFNGKLYIQVLQRDQPVHDHGKIGGESYLLALDPATGKTLWRHVCPTEAQAESREAFSTPVPFEHNGRWELLVLGGDMISGHDPATGKEFWRWGTWNDQRIGHWRLVPSAVAGGGVVLACAPKKEPVFAVKLGGNGKLPDSAIAWKSEKPSSITADVPTPLFYQGDFFILSDNTKSLSRVEPATGKVKWTVATPGTKKYEASPTGADGKIYLMNFAGDVVVVNAADGAVLNNAAMGEPGDNETRSVVSVASGQLFIRTNTKLFCIGKPAPVASR